MSKKSVMNLLMAMSMLGTNEYAGYYISDEKVSECLMDMYFYMMYSGIGEEKKQEEFFNEFEKKFDNLNEEQQEMVKNEYIDIIETQNKNKEKVKKKGMNDYE